MSNAKGEIILTRYSDGTASLQSYDILISCAHCIGKPGCANFYNDGWATEITFYAGRTSSTTYSDTSNYIYIIDNDTFAWLYSGGVRMFDALFKLIVDAHEESTARWE